jgi:glucose-6-phosphate-specific signal transduction histidine kinase
MSERFQIPAPFPPKNPFGADSTVATALPYRSEAVMNAIKPPVSKVRIQLWMDDGAVNPKVDDDGIGLRNGAQTTGLGLRLMSHGADCSVRISRLLAIWRGTSVTCKYHKMKWE